MFRKKKYKLGICLSGGAALGYGHIGVLQALTENCIYPEAVAGTSMGAVIGVMYANDMLPKDMLQVVREEKLYKIRTLLNPIFSRKGISSLKTLWHLLDELLPANDFSVLKREFHVCVSNINKADWEIANSGTQLFEYVIASASIPFLFEPAKINKKTYVDGGLFNNLPAQALKDSCNTIIGVDVLPHLATGTDFQSTNEVLAHSIRGVQHHNSMSGRKLCKYLIEPPAITKFHEFSFDKYEEIYQIGYDATMDYIKQNPQIMRFAMKTNK